jgi:hypothetical protein
MDAAEILIDKTVDLCEKDKIPWFTLTPWAKQKSEW